MARGSSVHKSAVVVALLIIVHATLCAIQHRDYLKAVQQPFTMTPPEILLQCVVATFVAIWGILGLKGNFVPIRTTAGLAKMTMDSMLPGPDFLHFNTRAHR